MRLYGAIEKVEPLDDGTVRVHGIASAESVDDQGEVVKAEAIRNALPNYMKFPALREMHQLAAAGTTLEAEVGDDGVTRIVAHVVDPVAVAKVKNQVYRGFSIGGRVTQRASGSPKTITGLTLNEISLVDRPANPDAVFDCWKASDGATEAPFNAPFQLWACGEQSHTHLAKADAIKCLEIRAAEPTIEDSIDVTPNAALKALKLDIVPWNIESTIKATSRKEKTWDNETARKALWNIGQLACLTEALSEYCECLVLEAAVEGDNSPQPAKLKTIVADLCTFLRDQLAEDTAELVEGTDDMIFEGYHLEPRAVSATVKILQNIEGSEKLVSEIEKRGMRHNRSDQAMLDTISYALDKAMDSGTARRNDLVRMVDAQKAVLDAGATALNADGREMLTNSNPVKGSPTQHSTVNSGHPPVPVPTGTSGITHIDKAAGTAAIDAIVKAGHGHVALVNAAHDILCSMSDGVACKEGARPPRHSATDVALMCKAHDAMMGIDGVKCAAAEVEAAEASQDMNPPTEVTDAKEAAVVVEVVPEAVPDETLTKVLEAIVSRHAAPEPDPLMKAMSDTLARMDARMDAMAADVTKIKETPLPPAMMARPAVSVSKAGDNASGRLSSDMSDADLVEAFKKMSKEEQSLILIKASYAQPMRRPGITDGPMPGMPAREQG